MIKDKEEYRKQCKELTDALNVQLDVLSTVGHLQTLYGDDAKLSDIKKAAEADFKKANEKLEEFTKEEREALTAINAKYSCQEILGFIADGADSIDMVNAYLKGKL